MSHTNPWRPAAAFLLGVLAGPIAHGADARFHLGVWVGVDVADGEPANDIPGFGLQLRYSLSENWALGAGVGLTEYDFETPAAILGITQDPSVEPIDALAEATTFSAWAERAFVPGEGQTTWFLGAGLGAASVDVPDVAGARADGGQFDIHTEVSTEIIVTGFAGVRRTLGDRWYAEFRVHANQHFADWAMTDRVSGATGTIDDYLSFGGQLTAGFRW
ncbi:MAG TPA: hypothetical protein VFS58_06095 [Steroidobacteraceae bacterium]|nr:hypothetical protein [Steroidobacteraceae bacterium]